ncbi:MAG: hypothetical protein IT245_07330 [Bacteroidia bacterium]|nr:hypothetical protein [Bacteroidia bacterium]
MAKRFPIVNVSGKQKELPAGDDLKVQNGIVFPEITTPATPAAGTVIIYPKADGNMYQLDDTGLETNLATPGGSANPRYITFGYAPGSVIPTGALNIVLTIPYSGTITKWYLSSEDTTNLTLDIWVHASNLPTNTDSITASAKPTLTAAQFNNSSSLTGWITTVTAGDKMKVEVEVNSASTSFTLIIEMN